MLSPPDPSPPRLGLNKVLFGVIQVEVRPCFFEMAHIELGIAWDLMTEALTLRFRDSVCRVLRRPWHNRRKNGPPAVGIPANKIRAVVH